jgi:hypothetical protein
VLAPASSAEQQQQQETLPLPVTAAAVESRRHVVSVAGELSTAKAPPLHLLLLEVTGVEIPLLPGLSKSYFPPCSETFRGRVTGVRPAM